MTTITFSPQRADETTSASIINNIFTYNTGSVDLTTIPAGATAEDDFVKIDKDLEGNINIHMIWRYTEATPLNCFPKDLILEQDGNIFPKESTI